MLIPTEAILFSIGIYRYVNTLKMIQMKWKLTLSLKYFNDILGFSRLCKGVGNFWSFQRSLLSENNTNLKVTCTTKLLFVTK